MTILLESELFLLRPTTLAGLYNDLYDAGRLIESEAVMSAGVTNCGQADFDTLIARDAGLWWGYQCH